MKQDRVATFFSSKGARLSDNLHDILIKDIESAIILHDINVFLFMKVDNDFDRLCFKCVCELKEKYPCIKKAICCHDKSIKNVFDSIFTSCGSLGEKDFDKVIYLPMNYYSYFSDFNNLSYELIDFCDYFFYYSSSGIDKVDIFAVEHQKYKLKP